MTKNKNPYQSVRKSWSRSPVEQPHSSKKGAKGYNRKRINKETRKQIQDE